MNEIKFRAWNTKYKRMYKVLSMPIIDLKAKCFGISENGDFVKITILDVENKPLTTSIVNFIPIQYTGLKDNTKWEDLTKEEKDEWIKNGNTKGEWKGKEIYEGDIVEDKEWIEHGLREIRFGEEYVDASNYEEYEILIIGFYLTNYLGENEFESLDAQKARDLKIIGNIYKDPNLLKQKE